MPWSHKIQKSTLCEGKGCDKCTNGRLVIFQVVEDAAPAPERVQLRLAGQDAGHVLVVIY